MARGNRVLAQGFEGSAGRTSGAEIGSRPQLLQGGAIACSLGLGKLAGVPPEEDRAFAVYELTRNYLRQ